LDEGLNVIACIGEKLEDRNNGNTVKILEAQLEPMVTQFLSGGTNLHEK